MLKYLAVLAAFAAAPAFAQDSTVQPMSFGDCVQNVQTAQAGLNEAATVLVDTTEQMQVKMPVPDGYVTITCDALTGQVTTAHTN
jgi:hypothetical protein